MINVNNKMKNSKSEITEVEFRQSAEEDHVLIWKTLDNKKNTKVKIMRKDTSASA